MVADSRDTRALRTAGRLNEPRPARVEANLDGYPYEGGGSSPMAHAVSIAAFGTATQNMALPSTGSLQFSEVSRRGM